MAEICHFLRPGQTAGQETGQGLGGWDKRDKRLKALSRCPAPTSGAFEGIKRWQLWIAASASFGMRVTPILGDAGKPRRLWWARWCGMMTSARSPRGGCGLQPLKPTGAAMACRSTTNSHDLPRLPPCHRALPRTGGASLVRRSRGGALYPRNPNRSALRGKVRAPCFRP